MHSYIHVMAEKHSHMHTIVIYLPLFLVRKSKFPRRWRMHSQLFFHPFCYPTPWFVQVQYRPSSLSKGWRFNMDIGQVLHLLSNMQQCRMISCCLSWTQHSRGYLLARPLHCDQGVIKRCRPSWLTNSALVYEPKCGGGGKGLRGLSQWVQLFTWSPNKLWTGDITPYLIFFCDKVK
jgi:hypothetical protein